MEAVFGLNWNALRACLENHLATALRTRRAGWQRATREQIRGVTEEQRRQTARPVARPPEAFFKHARVLTKGHILFHHLLAA